MLWMMILYDEYNKMDRCNNLGTLLLNIWEAVWTIWSQTESFGTNLKFEDRGGLSGDRTGQYAIITGLTARQQFCVRSHDLWYNKSSGGKCT